MSNRRDYFRLVIALVCAFIPAVARPLSGFQVTFTKVADTFTPIPGASGTFALGFFTPALDNGRVAFYGEGEEVEGIYTDVTGVLARVADKTTPLPGNFGELVFELEPAIEAGNIVFLADGDEVSGVYLFHGGTLSVIADTNTAAPDTSGNFESFGFLDKPAMHDGQVVFVGDGPDLHSGVYRYSGGTLSTVADSNTPVPNRMQNFEYFEFNNVATHGGKVAFVGNWLSDPGVYLSDGGSLGVVADSSTAVPGDPDDQFVDFGSVFGGVDMDESTIAFLAASNFVSGVYRYDLATGQIASVVDDATPVPGQPEEVFGSYFRSVSVSGGDVAFSYGDTLCSIFGGCHVTPFYGVYVNLEGTLEKVIAVGDVLDGRVVQWADMGSQGFRGRQIAFWVGFDDGTEGIYVATIVPEPPVAVLGLIGLPVCLTVRRASRPKRNAPPWTR
jgi:hypothetical protein